MFDQCGDPAGRDTIFGDADNDTGADTGQDVIFGGEKIFPEEVEAALRSHPKVFDALIVGVPDQRFTERVAAVDPEAGPAEYFGPDGFMQMRGYPTRIDMVELALVDGQDPGPDRFGLIAGRS